MISTGDLTIKKIVDIFDIDGCIMPSIFPNISEPGQDRDAIIKEVNKKGYSVKLFNGFLLYFKNFCLKSEKIYFITGRQAGPFATLTKYQLDRLLDLMLPIELIFYPEDLAHTPGEYYAWKKETILKIMLQYDDTRFRIYDDLTSYFMDLLATCTTLGYTVSLNEVTNNDQWLELVL